MNDNIKPLFPDAEYATENSTVEVMAKNLEDIAAELRSGVRKAQFGAFLYKGHDGRSHVIAVGDTTDFGMIALTQVCAALVMNNFLLED